MHSDLKILGVLNPIKFPSFPTLEDSLTLPYPAVKSMRGTRSMRDMSALIITGVSTGEVCAGAIRLAETLAV
jgi:hypothetical protein